MKLNLAQVPFSYRGSYMVFSSIEGGFHGDGTVDGLYLRTVHGSAKTSFVARLSPSHDGKPVTYTYEADPSQIIINTDFGTVKIAFHDVETVLIHGDVDLLLDFLAESRPLTFAQPYLSGNREFYLINSFDCNSRYMLRAQEGNIRVEQNWNKQATDYCRITLNRGNSSKYTIALEENFSGWVDRNQNYSYREAVTAAGKLFEKFRRSMPSIPEQYAEAGSLAAYVDWSCFVAPCDSLKDEAMLMSKNWMCNIWSWDHCFNAMALAYKNPKEAWAQYMLLFRYQDASGCIPDSVNDAIILRNFCKPPIHGWTLRKMMHIMEFSRDQLRDAYDHLERWTSWWLDQRDENGDGLCEYTHGNDSGWDNSSAFCELPPVTSPDLNALLVVQMDVLSDIAQKLNMKSDSAMWKERSDFMLKRLLSRLFQNGKPVVLAGLKNSQIQTNSLLPYVSIVLGKKLPEEIRKEMIRTLESKKFITDYGIATESPASNKYVPDGYWLGPIWAPSTMLVLDGMKECGETDFVREMTHRFCRMTQESGFAENFDALTGEGLRDRAYTWTASIMLVMAHEYIESKGE